MPTILMVAFHFPPMTGSSGQMRAVSFANTLVQRGWDVHVLTASAMAHVRVAANADEVLPEVRVHTALALDTARHLSLRGRYPDFLAVPDRWWTWAIHAVPKGLAISKRLKPDVIWFTYPIATAAAIGCAVSRLTSIPLVADLRDPMVDDHYPKEPQKRRAHVRIEEKTMSRARRIIFTSRGSLAMYRERYPQLAAERLQLIENGYDDGVFAEAEKRAARGPRDVDRILLTHSGSLYPKERDPRAFFRAVAALLEEDPETLKGVQIVLRGTGHDAIYRPELAALGIDDIVRLEPPLAHVDAVAEMLASDGLLLFQATSCNHQTPAKVYEYLQCGKPILALTDPAGDTAFALRDKEGSRVIPLHDAEDIARGLREYVTIVRQSRVDGSAHPGNGANSRSARGVQLDDVLRSVIKERRA